MKKNTLLKSNSLPTLSVILSCLLLCAALAGCSQGHQAESNVNYPEYDEDTNSDDVASSTDDLSLASDEVPMEYIFGDGAYGVYIMSEGSDVVKRLSEFPLANEPFTPIDRSKGQQLILVSEDVLFGHAGACFVDDWGYYDTEDEDLWDSHYKKVMLTCLDEFNGEEFETESEAIDILEKSGLYILGPHVVSKKAGATLEWGQYQGTHFASGQFVLDTPYYTAVDYGYDSNAPYFFTNGLDCPLTKTKEGYFLIDVSDLEPGNYLLNDYAGCTYRYPIRII